MKKMLVLLLGLIMISSLVFFGCSKKEDAASSEAALIGLAMPETHVERWIQDGNSLKAEAEARGYRAEVNWANADQNIQNQQIESYLTNGAKLLIIGSVNEGVISAVASAARDEAIVIAYDRLITGTGDYNYYITFDNFKVGQFQGQGIVDGLNLKAATAADPKYITLFAGSPTDNNAFFFYDGAMDVLTPYIDSGVLKVIGPYPKTSADRATFQQIATENWTPSIAKTRMENLLSNAARDVTLDAVLSPNDTLARAILEACDADAKYAGGNLPIAPGQDAELASVQSIKDGRQYMTVFKDTRALAKGAIALADALLKGTTPNIPGARLDTTTYTPGPGIPAVNSYLLEPVIVTKDNYQSILIDSGFYKASDIQ
ncbi:MAG: sugar-binding protein [Treponema sp.]|jgi:putative multiple sugar transport system substrate-binding protein|nr:sugar-binding protein [Treponema sp.]